MKQHLKPALLILAASLASATLTSAATVVSAPASTGIDYRWGIGLNGNDSGLITGSVGQWSWQDPGIGGSDLNPVGWGHSTQWIAVTLSADAILQLDLARNANVANPAGGFFGVSNYFPSFTIWRNHDIDPAPATFVDDPGLVGNWHTFANNGNVAWAEDLSYLDHLRNTGTQEAVSKSWALTAGNYTVVVGGLAPTAVGAAAQGYGATFTTSPIPEPGSLAFLALTGLATLRRRRRQA
jgi:hypothetical protein